METQHLADPKRPYKMYGAALLAFLTSLVTGDMPMPLWVKALIIAVIAGLTTFFVKNPAKVKGSANAVPNDADTPLWD